MSWKNILFSIFLIVSLTSCFEIIEQVKVNGDQTGSLKLIINVSQSKERLDKILSQKQINGLIIPSKDTIKHHFSQLEKKIKESEGLTLQKADKDFENYIFTLVVDFKNVNQINGLLSEVHNAFGKTRYEEVPIKVLKEDGSFKQQINKDYISHLDKEISNYNFSELNEAQITSIFQFDKSIKSCSITNGKISKSGKSALIKLDLKAFLSIYTNQNLNIQLDE